MKILCMKMKNNQIVKFLMMYIYKNALIAFQNKHLRLLDFTWETQFENFKKKGRNSLSGTEKELETLKDKENCQI